MKELILIIVVLALLGAVSLVLGNKFLSAKCEAQWKDSKFQSRYSFMGNCQIKSDKSDWIPSKNYREL